MNNLPNILYMELLDNNYGNKRLDYQIIKNLKAISNLTVAQLENWFDLLPMDINVHSYKYKRTSNNRKISYYQRNLENLLVAVKLDKIYHFDYLFFASYDTYVFTLALFKIKDFNRRVFILHHNNIDLIDKSIKLQLFFTIYAKKVNHIVFENFIANHLKNKYGVEEKKIFHMPHPLNIVQGIFSKHYDCVGISNSNKEEWIKEIIDFEIYSNIFKINNVKVVLRSKTMTFNDGFLKVISGYLSDEEYYYYVKSTKTIFLPFPESFKYRTSGSIIDAFSNETSVIGSKILLFENVEKEYPSICKVINSANEFINYLLTAETSWKNEQKEFKLFKSRHSDSELKKIFERMFIIK